MRSYLTNWFLNLKLEVTLTEAVRLKKRILDLRNHGLEICPNLAMTLPSHYLTTLKCLLMQSNLIPEFFRVNCYFLQDLQGLTVDYNKLEYLPFDMRHLRNLTILNVSHNSFQNVRFFYVICQLKNLRILWANATNLEEIPQEIGELSKLRILGLRRNRIKTIAKELYSLENLRWLTLADNQISEIIPGINNLSSLVHLNLQRNMLHELPQNFNEIRELQYLYLDHNRFLVNEELKAYIRRLPNLKYCCLSHNHPIGGEESDSQSPQEIYRVPSSNSGNPLIHGVLSPNFLIFPQSETRTFNSIGRIRYSDDNNNNLPVDARHQRYPVDSRRDSFHSVGGNNEREWGNVILSRNPMEFNRESDENLGSQVSEIRYNSGEDDIVEPAEEDNYRYDDNNEGSTDDNFSVDMNFDIDVKSSEEELNHEDQQEVERDINMNCEMENTPETEASRPLLVSPSVPECDGKSFSGQAENHEILTFDNDINSNSLRQTRTQEWVAHQLSTGFQLEDDSRNESGISLKNSRSHAESRLKLLSRVKGHVDGFIDEAAHQAGESKKATGGLASSTISSATLVYIMPHGKKPQPYCLNSSASFTCNRTGSSSVFVSPSDEGTLANANSHFHLPLPRTTSSVTALNPEERSRDSQVHQNEADSTLFSFITSSTLNIDSGRSADDDEVSNYDPTDWDHSAPSSAIDDQDVISRFADFRNDGSENDGYFDEPLRMEEWDWRKLILPLALIR